MEEVIIIMKIFKSHLISSIKCHVMTGFFLKKVKPGGKILKKYFFDFKNQKIKISKTYCTITWTIRKYTFLQSFMNFG